MLFMVKKLFIIILAVSLFLNIDNSFSKDKDKKDKKDKTEKIFDKLLKDLEKADKKTKISNDKDKNVASTSGDRLNKFERDNINSTLANIESIQQAIEKLKREVKQHQNLNQDKEINELNVKLKNFIESLDNDYNSFYKNLNDNQKKSVNEQALNIDKSFNRIDKYFNDINKVTDNENYYNKTIEFEKEIRIIYRQYRAIDWILFEQ